MNPLVTEAAARIMDIMIGHQLWRADHDSDFLESADWATAMAYAQAALSVGEPA